MEVRRGQRIISPLPKPRPNKIKLGPMSFFKDGGEGRFLSMIARVYNRVYEYG